ncbi:hypothetical protein AVF2S5_08680 [Agrobacterium vitis]|nr:hypothetical protein [Agrobacterium vitis]NSZ17129.1 hypothetical protein [Agrobacterium vitis]UJL87990.1 hypothetical protein AVF2S5_08680 [Agrobacterium vitis]
MNAGRYDVVEGLICVDIGVRPLGQTFGKIEFDPMPDGSNEIITVCAGCHSRPLDVISYRQKNQPYVGRRRDSFEDSENIDMSHTIDEQVIASLIVTVGKNGPAEAIRIRFHQTPTHVLQRLSRGRVATSFCDFRSEVVTEPSAFPMQLVTNRCEN